jgi:hypothetical protein
MLGVFAELKPTFGRNISLKASPKPASPKAASLASDIEQMRAAFCRDFKPSRQIPLLKM